MSHKHSSSATEHFNKLIQFRQAAYGLLGNARDALFELTDAVIQMRQIQSFAELSCAPAFRRKWSSVYEALQDGRPDRDGLLQLYLQQLANNERLLLAGDHTAWQRLWADTLPGRSYQHQPTPIPGRRPVTIGHGYSTLAVIPETHSSWALPLVQERIAHSKPIETAAQQLRQVCQHLAVRPLSLWDSEYGCATFLRATADVPADKLIRLRTNLCLEGPTKPYGGRGAYPKHGIKFDFKDPTTWWEPAQLLSYTDAQFGPLVVRIWQGLRFRKALDCRMWVAQIERLQAPGTRRKPRILWLAWVGEEPPEQWWGQYSQRYPIDHWYRFAKGRLHWTLPRVGTPQQCERWSDLMPLITWELWLARQWVLDNPLPWQKPQARLSPGRVCQSMQNILAAIGTPTRVCKPRGKSPGWPKGRPRKRRERCELIRSVQWKTNRTHRKPVLPGEKPKRGRPKQSTAAQAT
ncbi:MAG TPA: NF041680 family putative transposase [Anaerolineales bacterium]